MASGAKGQNSGQTGDRKGDSARAERLRAALQLILNECEGDDVLTAWGIGDVARRALEPKP